MALVQQAEAKWREAVGAVSEMRQKLRQLLQDYLGVKSQPGADVEQFERLLILGEATCTENVLHHFLTNTLGMFFCRHYQTTAFLDQDA